MRRAGAGRSPADKGHGWPALAAASNGAMSDGSSGGAAVGPASMKSQGAVVATPDDPLSLCPEGQNLPADSTACNTQRRTGGGPAMKAQNRKVRIMPIMSLHAMSRVSTPCMRHVLWRRSGLAGRRFATGQDVPASAYALPLHACRYQRCFCEPHANHANSEKPRGCAQAGIPVGTVTSQQLAGRVSPRM